MRRLGSRLFAAGLTAALLVSTATPKAAPSESSAQGFKVFDGLLYLGKPNLGAVGLVPIAGTGNLWRPGVAQDTVDSEQIANVFRPYRNSNGYFYLDIETWPLMGATPEVRGQTIANLSSVISLAKRAAPQLHIGFYGLLPGITYWPLANHEAKGWNDPAMQASYREWRAVDQQLEPLATQVDAVFPSLYTFYDDPKGWESYGRQTLVEARRYGKPVYAFLWPTYHEGGTAELKGKPIPPEVWRAELELCAQYADGVVLWGGYQQSWDANAPWWLETLSFLAAHHIPAPYVSASTAP